MGYNRKQNQFLFHFGTVTVENGPRGPKILQLNLFQISCGSKKINIHKETTKATKSYILHLSFGECHIKTHKEKTKCKLRYQTQLV